jgi:hypothetical protein
MSAVQWLVCRALAVALLTTSPLAVPVAAQTDDGAGDGTGTYDGTGAGLVIDERTTGGPTGATTDGTTGSTTGGVGEGTAGANGAAAGTGGAQQSPTLTLDPVTGPPGSSVTAHGDGFGACYYVYDDVGQGAATIAWGGESVTTVDVDDGTVSADFPVPESAAPGSITVTATCDADGDLAASADFVVTATGEATDPSETGGAGPQTSDPATQDPAPTPGHEPVADPAQDAGGPEAEAADAGTPAVDRKRVGQLAAVVLVVAAIVALRPLAVRARRRPAWARAHVAAVPGAVTRNVLGITPPAPPAPPAWIVRIEPRAGIVTHVLEEVDR